MDIDKDLIRQFWPRIQAELDRIGFSENDPASLGFNGPFTVDSLEAVLRGLQEVPTGVGLKGFLTHQGIDADEVLRSLPEPPQPPAPDTGK